MSVGILLMEFFPSILYSPIFLLLGIILIVVFFFLERKDLPFKYYWLFGAGLISFFIGFGAFSDNEFNRRYKFDNLNEQGVFRLKVLRVPAEKARSYSIEVGVESFSSDSIHFQPSGGKAILYLSKNEASKNLDIGDELLVATKFSPPPKNRNPEEFDYAKFLYRKGFSGTAYADSAHWMFLKKSESHSIFRLASNCRSRLLSIYKSLGIEGDEFAVLAALTLGYKDAIEDDLYAAYSNSGAMHILSVSGLHVGIIFAVFSFLFSFLGKSQRTRMLQSILIIALLWCYAFITGLSPSVMRSALMFSLVALASVSGRRSHIYNTIFLSAFILLLLNPNYIFDISFQLSYSAVLSIVFFQPYISKQLIFKNKILRWVWNLFSVSIAAQIGTFPLGLYYFQKFSTHFMITNFVAIPFSTLIIYLAVLLFVVYAIPFLGAWVGLMLKLLLKIQNESILFIESLPYSTLYTWVGSVDILLLYLGIIAFTVFLLTKKYSSLMIGLGAFLLIQIISVYAYLDNDNQKQMLVYNDNKSTTVDFIEGKRNWVFSTDRIRTKQITSIFWLKNRINKTDFIEREDNPLNEFISFAGKNICVLTDADLRYKVSDEKLNLDYLIIGGGVKISFEDISNLFEVKQIIVDGTYPERFAKRMKEKCDEKDIAFYSTKESGCFMDFFE